jgi:hypothetical protein
MTSDVRRHADLALRRHASAWRTFGADVGSISKSLSFA